MVTRAEKHRTTCAAARNDAGAGCDDCDSAGLCAEDARDAAEAPLAPELDATACNAVHAETGARCWFGAGHECSHEAPRPVPGLSLAERAERGLVIWARRVRP